MSGPLILASASAARAALLRGAGLEFTVDAAAIDEPVLRDRALAGGAAPADIAADLALAKAQSVAARHPGALVLGADQVLVHGALLLAKPADRAQARAQLASLRGTTHRLISAAALVRDSETLWQHAQPVEMTMRAFSDAFLDAYLARAGDEVLSSVGCYHLEGVGAQLFDRIQGDYFSVLGLPLLAVLGALRDTGHLPA